MEALVYFLFKMIAVSVAAIMFAYYSTPLQLIKRWFFLWKIKLFNCAICLIFWISLIVFIITSDFSMIE